MCCIEKLQEIASAFRYAVDNADKTSWSLPWNSFPKGSCNEAAEALGRVIEDLLGITPNFVVGWRYESGERKDSHVWLEIYKIIIDVTGDQFGADPVLVTKDGSWHSQWTDRKVRPINHADTWWNQHCAPAYCAAMDELKDQT